MQIYQTPAEAETGQVLGKAYLSQFRDNRDYFHGIIDRWRTVPEAVYRGFVGTEAEWKPSDGWPYMWDGWHYLKSDATTLHYYFRAYSGTADNEYRTQATLYYDGTAIKQLTSTNGWATADDTYDLSGKTTDRLYRVYYIVKRFRRVRNSDGTYTDTDSYADSNAKVFLTAPWTSYTSTSTSYTSGSALEANPITAAGLNTLRENGQHWYANTPPEPAFLKRRMEWENESATTKTLYAGYITHYGNQLRYKVELSNWTTDQALSIYYYAPTADSRGTAVDTINVSDDTDEDGIVESYCTISGTTGNDYIIEVEWTRGSGQATARVHYLYTAPSQANLHMSWTAMGELTVGSDVEGDQGTAAQRVNNFFLNDAQISDYLQRKDFAVRKNRWKDLGQDYHGDYHFIRRHDLLYYRGASIQLNWTGGGNTSLPDATGEDASGLHNFGIYDLNTAGGLHPGMAYWLDSDDLEFAQEYPA